MFLTSSVCLCALCGKYFLNAGDNINEASHQILTTFNRGGFEIDFSNM